jgi:hypothetical protein
MDEAHPANELKSPGGQKVLGWWAYFGLAAVDSGMIVMVAMLAQLGLDIPRYIAIVAAGLAVWTVFAGTLMVVLGRYDAVASSWFKAAPDGRKLFFPWGAWGRGYIVASEHDYLRLQRQFKVYTVSVDFLCRAIVAVVLVLVLVNEWASLKGYLVAGRPPILVALGLYLLFYAVPLFVLVGLLGLLFHVVWVRNLLPRLQPSDERLSRQEIMTSQARAYSAAFLWSGEITALAFVIFGVFIFIFQPRTWPIALASIVFFGFIAVIFRYMLVLRRRPTR